LHFPSDCSALTLSSTVSPAACFRRRPAQFGLSSPASYGRQARPPLRPRLAEVYTNPNCTWLTAEKETDGGSSAAPDGRPSLARDWLRSGCETRHSLSLDQNDIGCRSCKSRPRGYLGPSLVRREGAAEKPSARLMSHLSNRARQDSSTIAVSVLPYWC
jgi:hypothetical protein